MLRSMDMLRAVGAGTGGPGVADSARLAARFASRRRPPAAAQRRRRKVRSNDARWEELWGAALPWFRRTGGTPAYI
eukprot:gene9694-6584_t